MSGEDAKNSSSLQIGETLRQANIFQIYSNIFFPGMSAGHLVQGGDECLMSQDGHTTTSGSGSRLGSGSREGVDDYKPPVLTEDLLDSWAAATLGLSDLIPMARHFWRRQY